MTTSGGKEPQHHNCPKMPPYLERLANRSFSYSLLRVNFGQSQVTVASLGWKWGTNF